MKWQLFDDGAKVHIDSKFIPTETIACIDLETNELEPSDPNFKIICVGICANGVDCYVYFDITPELIQYLKTVQIVAHSAKNAEIAWLAGYGITIEQLYWDTKIAAYVMDSSRKNNSLKPLLKDMWGVEYPTYEEMTTSEENIKEACELHPELMIQRKVGPRYPKKILLGSLSKETVAAYNGSDVFYTHKLWQWQRANMDAAQLNFYSTIELPTTRLLYKMEQKGVKIDTREVRRIHNENSKERRRLKKQLFEIAGQSFNTNSPKQVLPILQANGVDTESTGEDALVHFRATPIVCKLLEFRKKQKICSTYTIPLYHNAVKDKDNRIHAHYNQNTITGRLSSSKPLNLQNQPPAVRTTFVAEEGHVLVGGDLSNLELRLPAHFSGDPVFVRELSKPDGDLHTTTAKFLFGAAVTSLPEEEFKKKRAKAKTCNFLLTNSGSPYGLANELQCTVDEAEELYKKFWAGYPVMAEWLRYEKKLARAEGGATSYFGRFVPIAQLKAWCGNNNCDIKKCKECKVREEAEGTAISIRVQGTGGDMIKLAMLRMYKDFGYIPVLSTHDEIELETRSELLEETCRNLKIVMESVVQLRVPLVSKIKYGRSWLECH